MGSIRGRRVVVGVALVLAIAGASGAVVVFSGGGTPGESVSSAPRDTRVRHHSAGVSTTTVPTTSSTATTVPPPPLPPPPIEAPPVSAPAASASGAPPPVQFAPAPPPPPPVSMCSGGARGLAGAVLAAMNADRGGLGALCWNDQLGAAAQGWASTMAANLSLSHSNVGALLSWTSFNTVAENVLVGPAGLTADAMERAWMASPSHRANILGGYIAAGVGIAQGVDGQLYVAVEFGG